MPVVTPDGIVGKVVAAYPTASSVMLITDPDFAAGVISQKNHVTGTIKGQGYANCKVDYVPNEEKVDVGEWFFTSGDDRIFPKGFPVGVVRVVRPGSPNKEIFVEPSGLQRGLEAVLIMLEGVHQDIPEAQPSNAPVYLGSPPPGTGTAGESQPSAMGTDADRLRQTYEQIGAAQNHKFGVGLPGSKPPDFNLKPSATVAPQTPGSTQASPGTATPPGSKPQSDPANQPLPKPAVPVQRSVSPETPEPQQ